MYETLYITVAIKKNQHCVMGIEKKAQKYKKPLQTEVTKYACNSDVALMLKKYFTAAIVWI